MMGRSLIQTTYSIEVVDMEAEAVMSMLHRQKLLALLSQESIAVTHGEDHLLTGLIVKLMNRA